MKIWDSIRLMTKQEDISPIRERVKRRSILIVSRYNPKKKPSCVYSIIGKHLGDILRLGGATVTYCTLASGYHSANLYGRYNAAIICYFDTDVMVTNCRRFFLDVIKRSKRTLYYSNVVPYVGGFDRYLVSRRAYLEPSCNVYRKTAYEKNRNAIFKLASFVGRGANYELFKPEQSGFTVMVDGSRGPPNKASIAACKDICGVLGKKFTIDRMGFNKKFGRVNKRAFLKTVPRFNRSHVYVSGITGLYELPVIESQCAGSYVISYRDKLHSDLLDPETSSVCSSPDEVLARVEWVKNNFDPKLPRKFAVDNYSWIDVVKRIVVHL